MDELEKIVDEFIEIVFKDIKYEKWIEFEYEDITKCLKLFIISSVINYKSYFYGEFLSKIKSCIFIKEMIEKAYEKSTRLTKWKKEIESYRILNEEKTLEQIVKIIYDILIKNTEIVCECDKVIINKNEINKIKEKVENKNKEPFKQIKREKNIYLQLPSYLSLNESKELLNLYTDSTKINEIRDNAILHLFLNCGLRVSELKNLNISDFKFNNNTFIIFGKGNKERTGYLNNSTKEALENYLNIRKTIQPKSQKDKDALFLSNKRVRICTRAIELAIDKAYEKAGLDKKVYTVHTLRHTCATLMYKNGIDIKIIKEVLGHVRIDTAEIYTHLHNEDVMKAMFEHPLSQFKMADALMYCTE